MVATLTVELPLVEYAKNHDSIHTWAKLGAQGAPAPQILIVACFDPGASRRTTSSSTWEASLCHPDEMKHADTVAAEALIVRNAAANAKAALPTILGVDTLVKFTDILVVKHTDCGGLSVRDAHINDGQCQPDRKEV